MPEVFAPKEIPVIKKSGLVLAMVLCASLLSACDCDGDCDASSANNAVSPTVPAPAPVDPPAVVTPPVTPVVPPAAAKCADPRFCKFDSTGSLLDDSATSWSCVQDKLLGNFWEVKTDDAGLRDKDWTYAKTGAAGACGDTLTACSPDVYVAAVNAAAAPPCGTARTCRLPTHPELIYLSFPDAFLTPVVAGVPTTAGKVTSTVTGYMPPAAFFPDIVADGFYFNSGDARQVAYGVSIPAGSSVDAISLLGMASGGWVRSRWSHSLDL
ncbi:hypothetical protein [Thiothrix subterranea]|uniref:hypothetical protein n=1 Tax=Thiothrix subterranea TaxID=2735563 RepID=UPI00280A5FAC|nr:hypothetical protein [Thiothrix subterranea]